MSIGALSIFLKWEKSGCWSEEKQLSALYLSPVEPSVLSGLPVLVVSSLTAMQLNSFSDSGNGGIPTSPLGNQSYLAFTCSINEELSHLVVLPVLLPSMGLLTPIVSNKHFQLLLIHEGCWVETEHTKLFVHQHWVFQHYLNISAPEVVEEISQNLLMFFEICLCFAAWDVHKVRDWVAQCTFTMCGLNLSCIPVQSLFLCHDSCSIRSHAHHLG